MGHAALFNLIRWQLDQPRLARPARTLQFTSLNFDVSFQELFSTFSTGGTLVLIAEDTRRDVTALVEYLHQHHIERLYLPFVALEYLAQAALKPSDQLFLTDIITAGEQLKTTAALQHWLANLPDCRLHNHYGPTESHVVTSYLLPSSPTEWAELPPVGKPIASLQIHILDSHHQPQPPGLPGELCIAGVGLARGYLNRPDLTAEKFPEVELFGIRQRIYKTGDLARWLPDGNLEYLGRLDHQIKLHGFRIELGEIETVLTQHEAVKEAVVVLREQDTNPQLAAYVTLITPLDDAETLSFLKKLSVWLKTRLPDYMIPTSFTVLENLPLTPNGKIDRQALPSPEETVVPQTEANLLPQTAAERTIATIWQQVLQLTNLGIHSNFFDLGGHSLLLLRVQAQLQDQFAQPIALTDLFEYPTIHSLAQHLTKTSEAGMVSPDTQVDRRRRQETTRPQRSIRDSNLAIIGMVGRWPGANHLETFWQNLQQGLESISFFTDAELLAAGIEADTLRHPHYVKAGGVLPEVDKFDANFFGFSPREAALTDPQQRQFLECAWEALESAGYVGALAAPKVIGVYAGVGMNTYFWNNLTSRPETATESYQLMIGNEKDFLPTRVSYKLNLTGPSVNVQTACSTSLVAVHLACQSVLNGECEIALAGGVSIHFPQLTGYWYEEGMIGSPDGHCRAFDANAQGTVGGNGIGIVVLRRLEEAVAAGDYIHAIIKGSAINNDGAAKVGYTAPSVTGQAAVIAEAQAVAGVTADTITYIEAHGTGTPLGDPIELAALTKAFRATTDRTNFCAIGSVKTNLGHTDTAAGVTGLIKTVLALKHRQLPPSLHFDQPNPNIEFAKSPFYVNTTLSEWRTNGLPRRAGVSSFGIGGTNAHVIVEETPAPLPSGPSRPWQLLLLSAKTPTALETASLKLATYLEQHPDLTLADVAYTLSCGRDVFPYRRCLVGQTLEEMVTSLRHLDATPLWNGPAPDPRNVVFMFTGQGSQYVNMGFELYQSEPIFRDTVNDSADYLRALLGLDLRGVLYPPAETRLEDATSQLNQTRVTQVALFVMEYALAKLWMSWGVMPQAMIGHSIGEYVAACLAGVMSFEDALRVVAIRGQLMQSLPGGAMLAVSLAESAVQPWLGETLSLAAVNTSSRCVVSGPTAAIEALQTQLTHQGVACRRLPTSQAFHSAMMTSILESFTAQVSQVKLQPPQIPYLSNVTGTWITPAAATRPSYYAQHLRQTVRFAEGLHHLLADPTRPFLEIGPGRTLSTFAHQHPEARDSTVILSSLPPPSEDSSTLAFLLTQLGKLWLAGGTVNWSGFYAPARRQRLPLPTYPFEQQRYWIAPPPRGPAAPIPTVETSSTMTLSSPHARPSLPSAYVAPRNELEQTIAAIWGTALGLKQVGRLDNFFELGGDLLLAVQVLAKLRGTWPTELSSHSLLNTPTIASLAEYLEQCGSVTEKPFNPVASSLVTIQPGHSLKRPLFLMHPVGGHVYFYRDLAQYLAADQPVYGLEAQGVAGEAAALPRVEDMATRYVAAIESLQPQGPYFLGGSSFGGTLAFEVAQQFHERGQPVALLALIDTPGFGYLPVELHDTAEILAYLLELGSQVTGTLNELRQLDPEAQLQYALARMNQNHQAPTAAELTELRTVLKLFQVHAQAMRDYRPRHYPGKILFFRAQERDAYLPPHPELAWIDLAGEGIEIQVVPGNHITMNEPPQVQVLAHRLNHYLAQARV